MLEMSSIDKGIESEIKFSTKEARRFRKWQNDRMKNEPLNVGYYIAEFYSKLKINFNDKETED